MFFLSSAFRLTDTRHSLGKFLGRSGYSYSIAMNKFAVALKEENIAAREISFPAIVRDARELVDGTGELVHLAFYPPEDLRLLKHAMNIIMFPWEFSTLRTDDMLYSSHPFHSQLGMIETADAVWTPSHYSAEVIRRSTKTPVVVVPAPIRYYHGNPVSRTKDRALRRSRSLEILSNIDCVPLSVFPRRQAEASKKAYRDKMFLKEKISTILSQHSNAHIYLTIINPHDARKGLREGIEAFVRFSQEYGGAVWIIKTSSHDDNLETINTRIFTHQFAREDIYVGQYFSDGILLCNNPLLTTELEALYSLSDYYICTSYAEGQNFPLQESMALGVVPISVRNTAMNDYITAENAIVIECHEQALPPAVARKYGLCGAKWFVANPHDIFESLRYSFNLREVAYDRLSQSAVSTIRDQYSTSTVCARIFASLP